MGRVWPVWVSSRRSSGGLTIETSPNCAQNVVSPVCSQDHKGATSPGKASQGQEVRSLICYSSLVMETEQPIAFQTASRMWPLRVWSLSLTRLDASGTGHMQPLPTLGAQQHCLGCLCLPERPSVIGPVDVSKRKLSRLEQETVSAPYPDTSLPKLIR
jgi:hypothetical protein